MSNDLHATQYDSGSSPRFLENLPSSIRRYPYPGRQKLRQIYDLEFDRFQLLTCHLPSDHSQHRSDGSATEYILFDIDPTTLEHDIFNPNVTPIPFRCSSFDITKGLLLVKMVTEEHSQAAHAMNQAISKALQPMKLETTIQAFSGVTIRSDGRGKEADYGWGPLRPPPGYARKPTIALEVTVSETPAKIRQDVLFWLDPNRGNANIAITLRVNRNKPLITIEKWEYQNQQSQRMQHITIAEDPNGERVTVSGSPLTIPFHLLFRRPTSSPVETDISIGQKELKDIAESIWAVQEF
ncbi:uncharacterized protein N7482_006560 [Penicillium canariense]|uniref:Uncharacterized protein n=1 Tax=Penicillium canariense TaxID=189055 RepID=A0A9W9LJR8_9EURO|nr:uncharacterized protein N7482_006560 [Penicillium canariense]KAJ5159556.1 hypothetical protein N7482_006560 [Penicillium canariense]